MSCFKYRPVLIGAATFGAVIALIYVSGLLIPNSASQVGSNALQQGVAPQSAELQHQFRELGYVWPPTDANEIPALAVARLPSDIEHLPTGERKELFLRALLPILIEENAVVVDERLFIEEYLAEGLPPLNSRLQARLDSIETRYRLKGDLTDANFQQEVLRRIDQIPIAIALAQAANESGWGTSRFAQEGNSLFGQWTYRRSGGLVPAERSSGASHQVLAFPNLRDSVRAYMRNLNMGHAYDEFRRLRAEMRAVEDIDVLELTAALHRYSQRGVEYVAEIRAVIIDNSLHRLSL